MFRAFGSALLLAAAFAFAAPAMAEQMASPKDAKVYFENLKDGDVVKTLFVVQFGVKGMKIAKAGTMEPDTGHFHLLIDTTMTPEQLTKAIPADAQHMHFGGGQTQTTLSLTPGKHTLQLLLGDGAHIPHNPPVMSAPITVTVEE
jgi:hypothetical protein